MENRELWQNAFFILPPPLRGIPSTLEGEFEMLGIQAPPPEIGEVSAKQTEEYDKHFATPLLL